MKLPAYLINLKLSALSVDYDYDWAVLGSFKECTDEDNPRLAEALQLVGVKAAFALGVACSEWVIARVEANTETTDALLRVEAAWAAAIDPRYASLPRPPRAASSVSPQFTGPLRLAMELLSYAHEKFTVKASEVRATAQGVAMLANHVAGRHPAFSPWISESLGRCHERFPLSEPPVEKERPVPHELFEPDFVWSEGAVMETLKRYVQSLDPSTNPYLRPAEAMLAAGFEGKPYPRLS